MKLPVNKCRLLFSRRSPSMLQHTDRPEERIFRHRCTRILSGRWFTHIRVFDVGGKSIRHLGAGAAIRQVLAQRLPCTCGNRQSWQPPHKRHSSNRQIKQSADNEDLPSVRRRTNWFSVITCFIRSAPFRCSFDAYRTVVFKQDVASYSRKQDFDEVLRCIVAKEALMMYCKRCIM